MDLSHIPEYVMNTLCRICAEKPNKLIPIFKDEFLPQKILKCLPIKISITDDLPLNICESCFLRINESYSLYETASKSNERLKKLWKILLKETMLPSITVPKSNILLSDAKSCIDQSQKEIYNNSDDVVLIGKAIVVEIVNKNQDIASGIREVFEKEEKKKIESESNLNSESSKLVSEAKSEEVNCDFKNLSKVYQCQFCFRQLTSSASLSVHESTHSKQRPFLCDSCGKSFKHANNLSCHARTHLGVKKKHVCQICSKEFLTKFFLKEHMNFHTGETPYKCEVCKKEFREKVHLRQHKWCHSSEKFICHICGCKFNRKGNMKEHIKKYHRNSTQNQSEGLQAGKEGFKILNEYSLKQNMKDAFEEKSFSCALCNKKFRHSGSLTYHRRTSHTGEKPFQCSYCSQKFSLRSVQLIHERKMHTFERPYKCTFCSRMFTNSSSLRNHLFVHSKQKMFECKECGKKFTRSSNLTVHKKLHTGDREFCCDQCGKSYIQKHDLLKHMKVHDPKTKPFFCKYCGNSFAHKKDSAKHSTCQFDYFRKYSSESCPAEKILDSVSMPFHQENVEEFFHQEDIIIASVEEISKKNVAKSEKEKL